MKLQPLTILLAVALAAVPRVFSDTTFTATGVIDMLPTSISDDGSIVVGVGTFGTPNLYYTEAGGAVVIGDGCPSGLPGISGDGTTIVGCHVDAQGKWNAAKWLGGTSWDDLGTIAGGVSCDLFLSGAYGINQDGTLAVGLMYLPQLCRASAGTWDVRSGDASLLPNMFGTDKTYSRANAVNADGTVIVGWQDQLTGERTAAKWVNGVEELILTEDGSLNGEAQAVSADGNAIVGGNYAYGGHFAWIWTPATGVQPIGTDSRESFTALDVSDDGKTVIGFTSHNRPFIWRQGKGTFYMLNFLRSRGAVIPDGFRMTTNSVISANGNIIYGWGFNADLLIEMFKVDLNASAAGPSH
jgi:uncharacterized membrane protein